MDHRIAKVIKSLTDGESQTVLAAAQEVVDNSTDKAGLISTILERSRFGGSYRISEEDRERLNALEHAGNGMCWAITVEVGRGEVRHLAAVTADGQRHGIKVERTSVVHATHLTVTDDGCLLMWSPSSGPDATDGVVAVAVGAHEQPSKLSEALAISPLSPDGSPMLSDARMEQALHALGTIASHLLERAGPPTGGYV